MLSLDQLLKEGVLTRNSLRFNLYAWSNHRGELSYEGARDLPCFRVIMRGQQGGLCLRILITITMTDGAQNGRGPFRIMTSKIRSGLDMASHSSTSVVLADSTRRKAVELDHSETRRLL